MEAGGCLSGRGDGDGGCVMVVGRCEGGDCRVGQRQDCRHGGKEEARLRHRGYGRESRMLLIVADDGVIN